MTRRADFDDVIRRLEKEIQALEGRDTSGLLTGWDKAQLLRFIHDLATEARFLDETLVDRVYDLTRP